MTLDIAPDILHLISLVLVSIVGIGFLAWKVFSVLRHFVYLKTNMSPSNILKVITDIQNEYIGHEDNQIRHKKVFNTILENLLELSQSEYGFITEIVSGGHEHNGLKIHALYNIDWTDADQSAKQAQNGMWAHKSDQ